MDQEREQQSHAQESEVPEGIKHIDVPPSPEDEVEGYIEQVEKRGEAGAQVPTDDHGRQLVQHVTPQPPALPDDAVVLPMTQDQFEEGIHAPIIRAVRWLAEWCAYIIKKFGEKVFFRG